MTCEVLLVFSLTLDNAASLAPPPFTVIRYLFSSFFTSGLDSKAELISKRLIVSFMLQESPEERHSFVDSFSKHPALTALGSHQTPFLGMWFHFF